MKIKIIKLKDMLDRAETEADVLAACISHFAISAFFICLLVCLIILKIPPNWFLRFMLVSLFFSYVFRIKIIRGDS